MSPQGPIDPMLPSTHASEISHARDAEPEARRAGLDQLLKRYRPALLAYVCSVKRISREQAEDMVHGFVLDKMLKGDLLARYNASRGRFRTFLLHAFDNYAANVFRAAGRLKRGGHLKQCEWEAVEPAAQDERIDEFDLTWVRQVLDTTLARMEQDCHASGRSHIWGVFDARVVGPMLHGAEPASYADLIRKFAFASPTQAFNALATAKRTFDRHLRQTIAEFAPGADVETELDWLRAVLDGRRA
ncbi:MAG: hypothetical protein GC162_01870 [Planctomycetes bacterium]|nr:hypothetical protein [Planctomycetota bacterium]